MTNKKSTKRALISSVLALIICISMLIGTTFAWFTDSVTSGRNTIQSGNLDVELYYSVLNENGEWSGYEKVTANTDIFGYSLWEPGYTQVAKFKVVNEGSLALKYQLTADVISESTGLTKGGSVIKLSDHIVYGVTEDLTVLDDRATAAAAATTKFGSFEIKAASLAKKESKEIGMVITMPTTVGNEANHDGEHIPSIEFGINLIATQEMAEYDSFGKDYDALATYIQPWDGVSVTAVEPVDGVYYISDGAELAYINDVLATLPVETGIKVVLDADINLGNHPWTPIGETTKASAAEGRCFEGTFDGMGHTIYNVNVNVTNESPAGLFGDAKRAVIKNLNVVNIAVSGNEWVGGIAGMVESSEVVNCSVTNGNIQGTSKVGGLVGDLVSSKLSASSVTNTVVVGEERVGGLVGRMRAEGAAPSVNGNEITDSVVSSTTDASASALVSSVIAGTVADNNTAENVDVLTNKPITTIASASDLASWAANPTEGNVFITSDIDLSNVDYAPMEVSGKNFVLDGMGHTINGLTSTGHRTGLIGKNNNGDMTIKNLTLTNVNLTGDNADGEGSAAAFIGYYEDHTASTVILENCHVDGMEAQDAKYMGGLVGYTSNSGGSMIIKNCSVKNATLNSTYAEEGEAKGHVGGLVGRVHVTDITGCVTENVVITTGRLDRAGEIAGTVTDASKYTESNNTSDVTIASTVTTDNLSTMAWKSNTTYRLQGTFDSATIQIPAGLENVVIDGANATFNGHVKATFNRIADGYNYVTEARTGSYVLKNFTVNDSLSIGACSVESLTVSGCDVEMMDFNASNTNITLNDNKIIRVNTGAYTRYDGNSNNNNALYFYADNYNLVMTGNVITDTVGAKNLVVIQGNYEQYQKDKDVTWSNSVSMTDNTLTCANDNVVKIYNDVTYAPVVWPEDYEITSAAQALAKQLFGSNTVNSNSNAVIEILCRAAGKNDLKATEFNNDILKEIAANN